MVKLIITDTYYGAMQTMCTLLGGSAKQLDNKNLVFCDEKASLMAERMICEKYGGSFNTEVYSFGNYLRAKKPMANVLTKEASAMVVKRILGFAPLKCFRAGKTTLAPSLLELILQLKSAGVTPQDLYGCLDGVGGVLKNKLTDITTVFDEYERFLLQNGYDDQNSALAQLPEVILNSTEVANSDVYLVGFSSFTNQAKQVIECLIRTAKSVTAVLVEGDNTFAYVNESTGAFLNVCARVGVKPLIERLHTENSAESKILADGLFNPLYNPIIKQTDKIYKLSAKSLDSEVEAVACIIKEQVQKGMRYKDFSVALPDAQIYREEICKAFRLLDVPFFLDEKKKPDSHPLILFICAYVEIFRKGAGKKELCAFIKNPLWNRPKEFTDGFENYIVANNLCYGSFYKPFVLPCADPELLTEYEAFRQSVCEVLDKFDVERLLEKVNAQERLNDFGVQLTGMGEREESAVNEQVYDATMDVLSQMKKLLGSTALNYTEFKNVFLSGVGAMELSIIPQYNDAVFVGDYKQISLAKTKRLFAVGLTQGVPSGKEDVALLSDGDIDALAELKVMIEPKIKVVNHRQRESIALALSAFDDALYVSYPTANGGGEDNGKSEVYEFIEKAFTCQNFPKIGGYYTDKQALLTFAKSCSQFADGTIDDFSEASSYFSVAGDDKAHRLLNKTDKEVKLRLDRHKHLIVSDVTSPTAIEDFNKCPYMSFLSHALRLRKADDGSVNGLSVGNLMHEIFAYYIKNLNRIKDEKTSDTVFKEASQKVLEREEFLRYTLDPSQKHMIDRVLAECKKFCYKNYLWLKNSSFIAQSTDIEVKFGKGGKYDAIELLDGKIKLSGKIDRVDTFGDYFRVIDYKTGSADSSEDKLFAGVKLQLYLYALALKDKKLAGAYYMPISDNYTALGKKKSAMMVGKTLDDLEVIKAQDGSIDFGGESEFLPVKLDADKNTGTTDADTLKAFTDYAYLISQKTAQNMQDGVIVASPVSMDGRSACEYCDFKGLCDCSEALLRTIGVVKEDTVYYAVNGGEQDE